MSNDATVEARIQELGLTAPRITLAHVESKIVQEEYHVFEGSTLTVCCLTLENGFNVTGESACASPENYNAQLGYDIARGNAVQKIWALEAYLLKQRLFEAQ
jgi:hypothetical protein